MLGWPSHPIHLPVSGSRRRPSPTTSAHSEASIAIQLRTKLLVSAASFAVTLVAIEIGLRVAGYDPFGAMMLSARPETPALMDAGFLREATDGVRVFELVPSSEAHAWGADMRVNSHGFRDREYAVEKAPDTLRVVALGDSATFGVKLEGGVLWPTVLEEQFAGSTPAVEVLNLGVVGYDTLDEIAFFEHTGLAFEPDVVVVAFHLNDIGFASPSRDYIRRLETYGEPIYRIRLLQFLRKQADLHELTRQHDRTNSEEYYERENREYIVDVGEDVELRELQEALRARFREDPSLEQALHKPLRWYRSAVRIGKLRYALERLARLSTEHGFDVLFVPLPFLADPGVESDYDLAYAMARHEAERSGFEYVDVLALTRAAGHLGLIIEEHDYGHPNAEGHRIFAGAVLERLRELLR